MIMETISYGYPIAPSGLGGTPMSTPSTPTGTDTYAPQLYSQTQYVQPSFTTTQLHNSFSKYDEDANNNNHIYHPNNTFSSKSASSSRSCSSSSGVSEHESLLSELSCMSISESADERYSDLSTVSESPDDYLSHMSPPSPPSFSTRPKSKKNSRANAKTSSASQSETEEKKSRKDSFVYDVRLPDEQVLLFVPDLDLVKSHLMFAVREEVDVLKDRIVELMDRIKHLECENTILRQYASPDVLQQIQTQMPPHQLQQPSQHHSSTS